MPVEATDQVPPVTESVRVMLPKPAQSMLGPPMEDGPAFTVTIVVAGAPHEVVYEIAVVPTINPATLPEPSTVATVGVEDVQMPPKTASVSDVPEPTHMEVVPEIEPGVGRTVNVTVAAPHPVL